MLLGYTLLSVIVVLLFLIYRMICKKVVNETDEGICHEEPKGWEYHIEPIILGKETDSMLEQVNWLGIGEWEAITT